MKLVRADCGYQLIFQAGKALEWVIESPNLFLDYVQELLKQTKGEEGRFVLSDEGKELEIAQSVEMIMSPFDIDLNDKRILKKVYSDVLTLTQESDCFLLTQEFFQELQSYFYELEQRSGYPLEIDEDIDLSAIFKAMHMRIEVSTNNLLEKICEYIKIAADILWKKVFVFVNLRSYFTDVQVEQLIEIAIYNEVTLLLIETSQRKFLDSCTYCIVDKDECLVYS